MVKLKAPKPRRSNEAADVRRTVAEMLERIERDGIDAIRRYSRDLDGWDPESFRVSDEQIRAAQDGLDASLARHIDFALAQVRRFADAQRASVRDLHVAPHPGIVLGHRLVPVAAVGAYVPGGRYPLIASAFMTVAVAKAAGVEHVAAAAPPQPGGGIHPVALAAIAASGADAIYCIGGVQALAMLAMGIEVPAVDMLVGPGNAFVAEAKRQLYGRVGIDALAGPSEILLIADDTADPDVVALDLLAQAEHGPDSVAGLITTSQQLGVDVLARIDGTLATFATRAIAERAWRERGWVTAVDGRQAALALADEVASEHVAVHVREKDLAFFSDGLRNFGSLFLGSASTVVFGDKAIGTNHCLPTGRAARYSGGLWVGTFLKTLTFQHVTAQGAAIVAPAACAIATAEGLDGHARSAGQRL